jgi:hypothetical protein
VDQIKDREIGRLWAEHYPKSKTSGASKTLCMTIALMLEDKAEALEAEGDRIDKLHYLLNRFRIPKAQFY